MSEVVVETIGLCRSFGRRQALRGLDFQAPRGTVTALLGRNGAGKSTALKILMGLTHPTSGEARVFGFDVSKPNESLAARKRSSFVAEIKDLPDDLKVGRLIELTRKFYPRWRSDLEARYVRRFGLALDAGVRSLSGGTRTKLALLLGLCCGAELVLLDEPTNALDPEAADDALRAIVSQVAEDGLTVLLSSHQLTEVEQVADNIVVVDAGRAVVSGRLDDLQQQFQRIRLGFDAEAPLLPLHLPGLLKLERSGRFLEALSFASAPGDESQVLTELRLMNPTSIEVSSLSLKEIFLETLNAEA